MGLQVERVYKIDARLVCFDNRSCERVVRVPFGIRAPMGVVQRAIPNGEGYTMQQTIWKTRLGHSQGRFIIRGKTLTFARYGRANAIRSPFWSAVAIAVARVYPPALMSRRSPQMADEVVGVALLRLDGLRTVCARLDDVQVRQGGIAVAQLGDEVRVRRLLVVKLHV